MKSKQYLTATEAARQLEVKPETLYAYVSRGLIRSESTAGTKRDRRYRAEDVRTLKKRKELRRDPQKVTREALHWGSPLLESSITLIADGRLYYRGHDAVELARTKRVEEVVALIWNDSAEGAITFDSQKVHLPGGWSALRKSAGKMRDVELFQLLLPLVGVNDHAALDLRPSSVQERGIRIMQMMTCLAADVSSIDGGIGRTLARGWAPKRNDAAKLFDAALILAADHELNVSSFTVRCVASAGATPYGAVAAGLAALQGVKHGGYTEHVEAMLREIGKPEAARDLIVGRLRRGESIPGFTHPLYPEGDPRGRALFDLASRTFPRSSTIRLMSGVEQVVADLTGDHPTIDFGLVALTGALGLPAGTALTLFALGRTIGWIGHAIEQYELDRMIRPRARYTGRQPESSSSSCTPTARQDRTRIVATDISLLAE